MTPTEQYNTVTMKLIDNAPIVSQPFGELLTPLPEGKRAFRFLGVGSSAETLVRAAAANHTAWFTRNALLSPEFEGRKYKNAQWLYTPNETIVPFPRLSRISANETLDHLVAYCREKQTRTVACWATLPAHPPDLGARLCARGLEWGWQPHWMALEPETVREDFQVPGGLHIAIVDSCDWKADDLPYYEVASPAILADSGKERSRRMWHFGAWLDGKIVGHAILFVNTGKWGIGGIYNVGVVPLARRRGIGGAVTLAACRFAFALGCHYVMLNSAADFLYTRLGFQSLGKGQTWWLQSKVIAAPPPTPAQIAFAEAIGRGDLRGLKRLSNSDLPTDLNAALPCGITPMELAVKAGQPDSAEWLLANGAELDALQAWDLNWKERAWDMLANEPEHVNRRSGQWQTTLLHEAAMRNDAALAAMLLAAHPDLTIQDTGFHSTPLGWARHFERAEIIALIEQHTLPLPQQGTE